MKNILKWSLTCFAGVVLFWICVEIYLELPGARAHMTAQDESFVSLIKQNLKKTGDKVNISDIHPGDWKEVCFNPLGSYSNIEAKNVKGVGLQANGRKIINGADTYANDDIWGIFFLYPENKAEYYRIRPDLISPFEVKSRDRGICVAKEEAKLIVVGDHNNARTRLKSSTSPDYLEVTLTYE